MAEKLTVLGARGPGLTELARKTGNFGVLPSDSDNQALEKFADAAIQQNPGFKGDRGDAGPAGPTYLTLEAFRAAPIANEKQALADPAYPKGDYFFETDGAPYTESLPFVIKANSTPLSVGAWVRQTAKGISSRLPDEDAVTQDAEAGLNATLFVTKFGVKSDGSDGTAALNKAVRAAALRGGGEIVFDAALAPYQINGPVLLPSNVRINLNGQTLNGKGASSYPDAMFVTATLESGALVSNIGSDPESKLVQYAGVRNGKITNAGRVFHLRNFVHGCKLENIATQDCRQVYRMERCFDCLVDQMTARGSSDAAIPTYHHIDQANGMIVSRVNATTNFGMHLEGGTNAFVLVAPVFEGGVTGLKITGDCLGFEMHAPYFEAIQGRGIDLRTAGAVVWEVTGVYASFVDIILDDGGAAGTATVDGTWSKSNGIFNIGGIINGFTYRGRMQLDGPRNYCSYELRTTSQGGIGTSANWIVSPLTDLTYQDTFAGTGPTDIRARAKYHAGVVPTLRTGDVGDPVLGTIPYTTSTFPTSATSTLTINTKIAWRPNSLRAAFVLRVQDDAGIYKVVGDVWGDIVKQADTSGKTVTIADDGSGFLRLTVASFNNTSGNASRTGAVTLLV